MIFYNPIGYKYENGTIVIRMRIIINFIARGRGEATKCVGGAGLIRKTVGAWTLMNHKQSKSK